jgi:hypothetical protein
MDRNFTAKSGVNVWVTTRDGVRPQRSGIMVSSEYGLHQLERMFPNSSAELRLYDRCNTPSMSAMEYSHHCEFPAPRRLTCMPIVTHQNLSMLEIQPPPRPNTTVRCCNHSTVTDLARLRGKSTFKPSATASQYAMSWSGMTLSRPCNKSTVLGTSIRSVFSGGKASSPVLQMTIGRPFRAMTGNGC